VKWTRPYFDCGRSNKWIIGAVVPIADIYPRHTSFRHIEYPTYTAVSVMEMDFERIDINQCPLGPGNDGPNPFAGTAQCKEETTEVSRATFILILLTDALFTPNVVETVRSSGWIWIPSWGLPVPMSSGVPTSVYRQETLPWGTYRTEFRTAISKVFRL